MKKILAIFVVFSLVLNAWSLGGSEEKSVSSEKVETVKSDAITVADNKGIVGKYPGQYTLEEFEKLTGEELSFSSNPIFADMSEKVEDRLPAEPLVMAPEYEIGKYGGELRLHSRALESGTTDALSMRHVNLVRFSDDYKTIIPDIAKNFEFNEDFTELTFELREGHKWSDGHPFTTEDILFWWEDIQCNKDLNSKVRSCWVYGGEPMEVEAIDDYTVKFSFACPSPGFTVSLAVSNEQPFQPKHILKQFHKTYNPDVEKMAEDYGYKTWEIFFGVYFNNWKDSYHPLNSTYPMSIPTLESHVLYDESTEHRRFKANPYYHVVDTKGNQLPYMDEIYEVLIEDVEVTNLKISQGEIDYKAQGIDLLNYTYFKKYSEENNYDVRLVSAGMGQMPAIGFNQNHKDPVLNEVFNNLKFREAMSLALNREEINELIFLGLGKPMAYVPGMPERNEFVSEEMATYLTDYDSAKANKLLDEVGLKKGEDGFRLRPDGKPFIIYFTYSTQGGAARMMQLVKEYWDAVGVRTELKEVNSDLYKNNVNNNDHDITVWPVDRTESSKFYTVDSASFFPFYGKNAINWGDWIISNGESGTVPPDEIIELRDLYLEFVTKGYQSDEYNEIGEKMTEIVTPNLYHIGTVGDGKNPVIVHNRLGNVAEMSLVSYSYYYGFPFRPCQWYIK